MASAALSPGAPSSFLVRALCSGEGGWWSSDSPLARFEGPFTCVRRGAAKGCFRAPREFLRDWRRDAGARAELGGKKLKKKKKKEKRKPYNKLYRGRSGGGGGLGITLVRVAAAWPGRCSAGVSSADRRVSLAPHAVGSARPLRWARETRCAKGSRGREGGRRRERRPSVSGEAFTC